MLAPAAVAAGTVWAVVLDLHAVQGCQDGGVRAARALEPCGGVDPLRSALLGAALTAVAAAGAASAWRRHVPTLAVALAVLWLHGLPAAWLMGSWGLEAAASLDAAMHAGTRLALAALWTASGIRAAAWPARGAAAVLVVEALLAAAAWGLLGPGAWAGTASLLAAAAALRRARRKP